MMKIAQLERTLERYEEDKRQLENERDLAARQLRHAATPKAIKAASAEDQPSVVKQKPN